MWLATSLVSTSVDSSAYSVVQTVLLASTRLVVKPVRIMLRSTFGFKDQTVSLALLRVCTRILSTEDATHAVATASPALVQL